MFRVYRHIAETKNNYAYCAVIAELPEFSDYSYALNFIQDMRSKLDPGTYYIISKGASSHHKNPNSFSEGYANSHNLTGPECSYNYSWGITFQRK